MRRIFQRLEPQLQRRAAIGIALIAGAGVAMLVLALHAGNREKVQSLALVRTSLAQVQALSAQLAELTADTTSDRDLTALVMATLQAHDLQPSRLQQNGADELQLRLDGIAFADAVAWLATLESTAGIAVVRVSMSAVVGNAASVIVSVRQT